MPSQPDPIALSDSLTPQDIDPSSAAETPHQQTVDVYIETESSLTSTMTKESTQPLIAGENELTEGMACGEETHSTMDWDGNKQENWLTEEEISQRR